MLKVSVTYHLKSGSRDNGDGQTMSSLIVTGITYGLSLRSRGRNLVNFNTTDSGSLLNKALMRLGRANLPKLREY